MSFNIKTTLRCPTSTIATKKDSTEDRSFGFTNLFWAGGSNAYSDQLVATSNKGHAYVFNTTNKKCLFDFAFTNSELNTCAIEICENGLIAAGGFDGGVYVQNINSMISNERKGDDGTKKFVGHQGVVSSVRFLNSYFMVSASYDSLILLWDINSQGKFISSYHDHTAEVSGLDVNELNSNIFATGSGDTTVKLWDVREKKPCVSTFKGQEGSVNCVKFLPGR